MSGKLWHGVLVMFDRETGTLWTQLEGRAIEGSGRGRSLSHVPSTFTTWEAWRKAHPQTLVLEKRGDELERQGSHYQDYFDDPQRLWLDRLSEGLGGIGPKDVVFGVSLAGESLAIAEPLLMRRRIVNAVVDGRPLAWLFDERLGYAKAVERRLDGRVLVLEPLPGEDPTLLFRDRLSGETHSVDELPAVRVDRAYWYAWRRSHAQSVVLCD